MTKQKRGLGRGLDALLDPYVTSPDGEPSAPEAGKVLHVPIYSVDTNPGQPRKHFDEAALNELADSIRVHGIVQPLIVTRNGTATGLSPGSAVSGPQSSRDSRRSRSSPRNTTRRRSTRSP